jgi:phosphocarrier protein HPr
MIKKSVKLNLALGLHARPSAHIVSKVGPLKLDKAIMNYNGRTADLRSILSVLSLFILTGEDVEVILSGPDEEMALKIIEDIFNEKDNESIYNKGP